MANNKDVKRGVVIYIDGKEVKNNAKSIEAEMRKVRKEIDGCTIGSEEYIAATKRYKELQSILSKHRESMREVKEEQKSLVDSVNNLWQRWQLGITAAIGTLTAIGLALSKFRKEMNETESSQANLKALTGLDDESITWLTEQARTLSTTMEENGLRIRQSTKEILEAYMLVGSNKPELLADKEALNAVTVEIMRLAAAANMDLKDAVTSVTTAMNQFNASADEATRYTNVLAAGSQKGAASVSEQGEAILKAGVAAHNAGLSIEQLDGMIEMLAEMGIKGANAGTYLNAFLMKLASGSRAAKLQQEGLNAVLQDLRAEYIANEKALAGSGTAKFISEFSERGVRAATILSQNIEKLNEYTSAMTDTNTAIEQAAINSDTAEAKLAQMKNEFSEQGQILVKELNPAITKLVSLAMNSTKMLVNITRFLTENKVTIMATSVALAAYIAWKNRAIIVEKLHYYWINRTAIANSKLFKILLTNPYGILLVAITAVIAAVYEYNTRLDESMKKNRALRELEEKTNEEFGEQAAKIDRLNSAIHNNNLANADRLAALNELKSIIPEYNATLNEEGQLINDNTDAIEKYLSALEKQIRLKAAQEELEEKYREKRKAEKQLSSLNERRDKLSANRSQYNMQGTNMTQTGLNMAMFGQSAYAANLANLDLQIKKGNSKVNDLLNDIALLENEIKGSSVTGTATATETEVPEGSITSPAETKKEIDLIKEQTKQIAIEFSQRQTELKRQYAVGLIDKEEYNKKSIELEIERINRILSIAGLEPDKIAEMQEKLADIAMKAKSAMDDLDLSAIGKDNYLALFEQKLQTLETEYEKERNVIEMNHSLSLISEEDYSNALLQLRLKYNQLTIEAQDEYLRDAGNQMTELEELWEKSGINLVNLANDIGDNIGKALGNAVTGSISDVKDAMKSLLNVVIDSIEKLVLAATIESSLLTMTGISTAKGIANLVKLVAIKASFSALKAGVNSFDIGGYTGFGSAKEPAGIVHRNEFVANRYALANPAIKPILDVIDMAQKQGNISNLSTDDIAAATGSYADNTEVKLLIAQCDKTMKSVLARMQEPLIAQTYATGKGGVNEAQNLMKRMIENATY